MKLFTDKKTLAEFKSRLNSISPSFCAAKWTQTTLHLQNGRTHSCHHPYPHAASLEKIAQDPSALHNTDFKKQQRKLMLEGARPKECQYCWNVEDLKSFQENEIFSDRITKSSEEWSEPYLAEISTSDFNKNFNPRYVEVSFSNLCNFKCSYCSPVYSTKWLEEIETHGPYETSAKFNNLEYLKSTGELPAKSKEENPYVAAFWRWWPSLVKDLRVFRITGGEPLLSEHTYRILDELSQNPQPELDIAINTNGSAPDKLYDSFVEKSAHLLTHKKIKGLQVYTSIDGYGAGAEYARHGLNFDTWKKNLERLLKEVPGVRVSIMCTTNIFSVPGFHKFIEFVYDLKSEHAGKRITLDTSILRFPHHQNLCILTDDLKNSFDSALNFAKSRHAHYDEMNLLPGFYNFELNRLERLINYVKSGSNQNEGLNVATARADFFIFVNEHDKRRGTNFLKSLPELEAFYLECKKAHSIKNGL